MKKNQEEAVPKYLESAESTLRDLGENPLFTLSLKKLEPVIKAWVYQVFKTIELPREEVVRYYTRKDVCDLLKISMPTLSKYYKIGTIKGVRVGSRILFTQEDIAGALKEIPYRRFRRD